MSMLVDDAVAADYSDVVGPSLLAMTATLMALAGVRTGETVLDLGCGPGLLTLPAAAAAGRTGRVFGVDSNPAMLARAALRTSPATDAARVTWVQAQLATLPIADDSVHKVVCGAKLQHVADVRAAVAEVRRVLRPGGRFSVSAWAGCTPDPTELAVLDAFERRGLGAACARRTDLMVDGGPVDSAELPDVLRSSGLQVTHVADGLVTIPFVDAIAYAQWRLSFPRTVATLVDRADAVDVRADVLDAVLSVHGRNPVILELPVRYAVSRLA